MEIQAIKTPFGEVNEIKIKRVQHIYMLVGKNNNEWILLDKGTKKDIEDSFKGMHSLSVIGESNECM